MKNEEKISRKNIKLCIMLVIILIIALVYRFGYITYDDKKSDVDAENRELQTKLNDLKVKTLSRTEYEEDTKVMQQQIKDVINKYGPLFQAENIIDLLRRMEIEAGVEFPSISFADSEMIFSSTSIESTTGTGIHVQQKLVNAAYRSTYEGLKNMIDFITTYPDRINIDSITVSYNRETGNLSGNLVLKLYALSGGDRTYEEPVIGGIDIGMENIFSTTELPEGSVPNTGTN